MATSVKMAGTGAGTDWTTPGNITADDNNYALYIGGIAVYPALKATNFAFAIPTDATVTGLSARMRRFAYGTVIDNSVRWTKDGTNTVGSDIDAGATWALAEQADTLSGLGGSAFTPAEVNASTFGVFIVAQGTDADGEADVDFVEITVTYTPAAAAFTPKVMMF